MTDSEYRWHKLDIGETLDVLKTNREGLAWEEAKRRLEEYGPNEFEEEERTTFLDIFVGQFKSILVIMLLVAIAISVVLGDYRDAIVISIIVVANSIIGTIQETRAERSLEALKKIASPTAEIVREGRIVKIPSREVVPGDIVNLKVGDKLPADIRLIEAVNARTDESTLTGESVPVEKGVLPFSRDEEMEVSIADRRNMGFMATTLTYGRARGVVVATGSETEFGKIARMVQVTERKLTPLQVKLNSFGKKLGIFIIFIVIVIFTVGLLLHEAELFDMLLVAVSLAVSVVPEGLPAIVTITLALGMQRMAQKNAIVRKLAAVETLGSTTVICVDKTGTLTKNEMTVRKLYVGNKKIQVTGSGYEPLGDFLQGDEVIDVKKDEDISLMLKICVLCNDSVLVKEDVWDIRGDPTEGALLVAAAKSGLFKEHLDKSHPRIGEIPFDSKTKRMSTINKTPEGGKIAYVKGAPEVVIDLCNRVQRNGIIAKLTKKDREKVEEATQEMADEALRVLALAYKSLPSNQEDYSSKTVETDLIYVGLVGMIDPPRPEVKKSLKICKQAGIKVVMITGDNIFTAKAVAKEIGLGSENPRALTGIELDKLSEKELDEIIEDVSIYARVSPEHKVKIVKALKRKGHIISMSGDGINDAPAIKNADIGVAMGIRGTDVTKEASDMVLTDDNFETIVSAVKEGRGIYENIRKFIRLLLVANWDELAVIFTASIMGLPLPLLPVQILWINLLTDGLPATALSVDPTDPEVMNKKPRNPKEEVYGGMLYFIAFSTLLAFIATMSVFILEDPFTNLDKARTMAFTQAVVFELFLAFNCRSEERFGFGSLRQLLSNKWLIIAVLSSFVLQLCVIYVPILQDAFGTAPLGATHWALLLAFAMGGIVSYPKGVNKLVSMLGFKPR